MSQAPGLSGTPDSGHCSSAATRASWAESSARPTSRTIRASPAISLADSILQIASIVRWVAELTCGRLGLLPLPLRGLRAQPFLLLTQLGRELVSEVVALEDLTQLDIAFLEGNALRPLDRLLLRLHLPDPVAGDELLRLGERAVGDGRRVPVVVHAHGLRARMEALAREHHARLHELLVELAHLPELLLARHLVGLVVLAAHDENDVSHCVLLRVSVDLSTDTSNEVPLNRHGPSRMLRASPGNRRRPSPRSRTCPARAARGPRRQALPRRRTRTLRRRTPSP